MRAAKTTAAERRWLRAEQWSAQGQQSGCAVCLTRTTGPGFDERAGIARHIKRVRVVKPL
jgi:hypothetical protein